ncbi:amidohydrolase, partial [Pseudomonas syringae]
AGPSALGRLAAARGVNAVVTGSGMRRAADGSHRDRLLWARPDGELLHYDKRHLFRVAGEHEHYTPGDRQVMFELNGWRVRPLICYDLRFPGWSRDAQDTALLLYTAHRPGARRLHWHRLPPARAIDNPLDVAAVNRVGSDGTGLAYTGDRQR